MIFIIQIILAFWAMGAAIRFLFQLGLMLFSPDARENVGVGALVIGLCIWALFLAFPLWLFYFLEDMR